MTGIEKTKLQVEAYEGFGKLAGRGLYSEAYSLLMHQPDLVGHMSLYEIPVHYASLRRLVGTRESNRFKRLVRDHLRNLEAAFEGGEVLIGLIQKLHGKSPPEVPGAQF